MSNSDGPINEEEEFFPLELGQQWTYQVTESDMDTSRVGFPTQFTVSVVDQRSIENKHYYLVVNYFVPGPSLPDTLLVRSSGRKVFARFGVDHDEHLLYSFAPDDTVWAAPFYPNPDTTYDYYGRLTDVTDTSATMHWHLFPYPRGESSWNEVFEPGLGRTKIVSFSQVVGRIVWRLEQI